MTIAWRPGDCFQDRAGLVQRAPMAQADSDCIMAQLQ
jgi:hypothetical protein